jgi:hypothetical protein
MLTLLIKKKDARIDESELALKPIGKIQAQRNRDVAPYQYVPSLIKYIIITVSVTMLVTTFGMLGLMYMNIGGNYPYYLLAGLICASFVLILSFLGKNGAISISKWNATTK